MNHITDEAMNKVVRKFSDAVEVANLHVAQVTLKNSQANELMDVILADAQEIIELKSYVAWLAGKVIEQVNEQ
ncbi:MAG: hypothetical protein WC322_07110 [Candidatus Paceibacterota bacterium]|jgi:hypothetical protein